LADKQSLIFRLRFPPEPVAVPWYPCGGHHWYPYLIGLTIRLSTTASHPRRYLSRPRTAFFSDSESTIPHNSAVPSWTMTLISDRQANGCRSNCEITFSRNVASSTVTAGFIVFPIVAIACSRFARLTIPTRALRQHLRQLEEFQRPPQIQVDEAEVLYQRAKHHEVVAIKAGQRREGAPSRCACCGKWGTLPKNLGRSPTGVPVAAQSEP
jgi:hypothetical protein